MNGRGVLGGVLAGALGAAVWAAVAYFANFEIGYLAWGIGGLVGLAVAALGKAPGPAAGVLAVAISVLSIVAGKYASVEISIQKDLIGSMDAVGDVHPEDIEESNMIASVADDLAGRRGVTIEPVMIADDGVEVDLKDNYPADIWAEATEQWRAKSDQEQQAARAQEAKEFNQAFSTFKNTYVGQARKSAFFSSFGVMDLVFFGLAVATAWGIAVREGD